jgi:type 1 fimbriae regulatory protein FimB/type 1 fimbriae regulatory protein FimE
LYTFRKRKVTPTRPKNADVRTREYLTEREIEKLIEACEDNRWAHRDQTMILLAFRHGLRASELCDLQWTQVDFDHASLAVTRAKNGTPATHPLTGRELRAYAGCTARQKASRPSCSCPSGAVR